ncbi:MAG: hypothetical protein JNL99_03045, partial [Zoogloea sp.]|nr:hypothetical protein [Zoogloea sp.]
PASPWAGRSEARTEGRFEGRRDFAEKRHGEFSERPRHPEHRTEFPHVAKRSSTHHNSGSGFGGGRSEGTGGKPRAGRTFNRDR